MTGNAARLLRTPTLCLCKAPAEEGPGGADAPRPASARWPHRETTDRPVEREPTEAVRLEAIALSGTTRLAERRLVIRVPSAFGAAR